MRILRESIGFVISAAVTGALFFAPIVVLISVTHPEVMEASPELDRLVTVSMDAFSDFAEAAPSEDPEGLTEQLSWEPEPEPEIVEPNEETAPASAEAASATPTKTAPETVEAQELTGPDKVKATVSEQATEAKKEIVPAKERVTPNPMRPRPTPKPTPAATPPTPQELARRTAEDLKREGAYVPSCSEPHPDIEKVADDTYIVKRDLIDFYTANMERFNSLGWSKRYDSDADDFKGWYISGFGCKSPLWKGGLRSKDIVQAINGRKTYNVVQIITIWATMRKKGDFKVDIIRKGQPLTLTIKVV